MNHSIIFSPRGKRWQRGMGAHRIASFLRLQDWDVEVIDYVIFWELEQLKELVKSRVNSSTVFFGFSTFFNVWSGTMNEFTKWLKEEYPHIPIVIGGQSVLLTDAENIDYWVDSYGENAIIALTRKLIGTDTSPITYDENYSDKKVIRGLTAYPSAPLSSYYIEFEKRDFMRSTEMPTIEISRGCKFACEYCNFPILGVKGDQSSSQDSFRRQIEHAYDNWGIKNWMIADETFNDRTDKIRKFADVVEKLSFKPWFSAFIRGDLLVSQRNQWDELIRMQVLGHSMGIETFNQESGKIIGKGMDPDRIKEGLIEFEKYTDIHAPRRYRANINLICGLPKETESSWNDTIDWLNKHWIRQSASAWILEISDFNNDLTNMSKFTRNLKKHGLRSIGAQEANGQVLTRDENGNLQFKSTVQYAGGVGTTREKICIWAHDNMDWYQAGNLVRKFYSNDGFIGRSGNNPILTDRLFDFYNTTEYEDIWDKDMRDVNDTAPVFLNIIRDYIDNKINWRS